MSEAHWNRYVATLETLEEIEGVLDAANLLGRRIPSLEADLLEKRVIALSIPSTANEARQITTRIRALAERAEK